MADAQKRQRSCGLFFVVFSAAFGVVTETAASPWTRDPGHLFVATRAEYFSARGAPNIPDGGPRRFSRYDNDNYIEYGLARKTMIGAKVVYGTSTYFDGLSSATVSGFSEIEGFVERQIWRTGRDAFAIRLAGAAPTKFETEPRPDLRRNGTDLELRALYGRNLLLSPFKIYASAEAGYRRRLGKAADQARADFLIGAEPTRRLLVLFEVFSTKAIGEADPDGDDYDIVKLQPSLVWRVTRRWSFQAGATHEIAGRNLILGNAWFAGLWTTF